MAMPVPPQVLDRGVGAKFIMASNVDDKELNQAIFADFLPQALAQGKYVTAPEPEVVGKGLELVSAALDLLKKGVSAKKLVVSL